jgi:MscS family membrane protein
MIVKYLILFLTLSTYAFSSTESPRETFKTFILEMKKFKKGDESGLASATATLNLSKIDKKVRTEIGEEKAKKLIQVIDRIEKVNFKRIPTKWKASKWPFKKKDILVNEELTTVEISIEKIGERWLFSERTVETIDQYYEFIRHLPVAKGVIELKSWKTPIKKFMPDWTGNRTFILLNGQWIGLFLLIFLGLVVEKFGRFYLARFVLRMLRRYHLSALTDKKEKQLTFPFGMMALAGFISLGVRVLELDKDFLLAILKGTEIGFTVATVILAHHLVDVVSLYFEKIARDSENKFDDILVPLIKKTGKFFVIAVGVIAIGDALDLDMKGILTGLGIGGLAFALAAKDTLSNLFGSLTVLIDKPFRIGDWVNIGGIEGIIEEVGLRSTRIRTFYDSLITVPNGTLTNVHVDNYGQRRSRRLNTKIGVQYDTPPERLEAFCEAIRELIRNHPMTKKDGFHVYFNAMGDFSLQILLYVFFIVPDWKEELKARHRLLMDILRLGHEMNIEFAFPTQTLHLNQGTPSEYPELSSDLKSYATESSLKVSNKNLQISVD